MARYRPRVEHGIGMRGRDGVEDGYGAAGAGEPGTAHERAALLPATRKRLAGYRTTGRWFLTAGVVTCLAATALRAWVGAAAAEVETYAVTLGVSLLVAAAVFLRGVGRVRTVLERYPWRPRRIVRVKGAAASVLLLEAPEYGELWPLTCSSAGALSGAAVVWAAGDPRAGAVILSPRGGEVHHRAVLARGRRLRRTAAAAEVRALPGRLVTDRSPAGPRPPAVAPGGAAREDAAALTYARLAAVAERRAGGPAGVVVREADLRQAPWWRVRGLRRLSGVSDVCLGFGAMTPSLSGVVGLLDGTEVVRGCFTLLLWVVGVALAVRHVRGRAPHLRRVLTAAAAAAVERRYVLLADCPGRERRAWTVTLVVYPASGGEDDLPEGVLEVYAPGLGSRPLAGLPAPTGTVELRGWPAASDEGAVVVPSIGGTVLWPVGRYQEAGPDGWDRGGLLDGVAAS
ncbi:hypothetical protein ABT026_10065 [Streptomyces sp. NPDC002734]|uniref:hypothetical protein n=1 Tax=Streptomyces sp. NPDC002734 TaxID=3154426 RepID=UPI003319F9C1